MKKGQWLWAGLLAVTVALALVGTWAFAQSAGNPEAEIKTAMAHAGYAGKADALNSVHLHLHHVLNCVVGSQDKMFDAAAGNPCKDQGNGALPDIKAKMGQNLQYYEAWWAAQIASQGISSNDLPQAKAAAQIASLILEDAAKGK
jgi:hypothetical protein